MTTVLETKQATSKQAETWCKEPDPISQPNQFAQYHGLHIVDNILLNDVRFVEYQMGPLRSILVEKTSARRPKSTGFCDLLWVMETEAEAHRTAGLQEVAELLNA